MEELVAEAPVMGEVAAEAEDSGQRELTLEPMRLEIGDEPDDVVRIRVIRNAEEVLPESAISAERSPIVIEDVVVEAEPVVAEAEVVEPVVAEPVAEVEPEIAAIAEEPVVAEAQVVEPLAVEPVMVEPVVEVEPEIAAIAEEPVVAEAQVVEPLAMEPVMVEPVVEVEPEIAAIAEEPVVAEAQVVEPLTVEPAMVEPVVEVEPEIAAIAEEPVVAEAQVVEPLTVEPAMVEPVAEVEPEIEAVAEEPVVTIVSAEPEVVLPQVDTQMPIEAEAEPSVMMPAEILDLSPVPEFASNVIEMPASILAPIEEVQTAEVVSLDDDSTDLRVPSGFQDAGMLESLCAEGKPFTGFAVVVGPLDYSKMVSDVGQSEADRLMTDVTRTVLDLARPQDFIAKTADDEFVILYSGETGVASQRRSHSISEKIWDFQLRSLGSYSVVLTWGGSQGEQEPLRAVVENAREQMLESRRGRKSMVSSGAGRFRRTTPASA
jgi:GGDEF domain-containing protein